MLSGDKRQASYLHNSVNSIMLCQHWYFWSACLPSCFMWKLIAVPMSSFIIRKYAEGHLSIKIFFVLFTDSKDYK